MRFSYLLAAFLATSNTKGDGLVVGGDGTLSHSVNKRLTIGDDSDENVG